MSERDRGLSVFATVLLTLLVLAVINLYGATIQNYDKMQQEIRDLQRRVGQLESLKGR